MTCFSHRSDKNIVFKKLQCQIAELMRELGAEREHKEAAYKAIQELQQRALHAEGRLAAEQTRQRGPTEKDAAKQNSAIAVLGHHRPSGDLVNRHGGTDPDALRTQCHQQLQQIGSLQQQISSLQQSADSLRELLRQAELRNQALSDQAPSPPRPPNSPIAPTIPM